MITKEAFALTLKEIADRIKNDFRSVIRANPEDQLKRPIADLIKSVIRNEITIRTEVQVEGLGARPDIGVAKNHLLCGHVELKAPNISVQRFTGDNKIQFNKFKALPNLIYTNGNEWILYRSGEQCHGIISFNGDITQIGTNAITDENIERLYRLLIDFLSWKPQFREAQKLLLIHSHQYVVF